MRYILTVRKHFRNRRAAVFQGGERRGRPVGVRLTNPAGSWSRPYENGAEEERELGAASQLFDDQLLSSCTGYVKLLGNFRAFRK